MTLLQGNDSSLPATQRPAAALPSTPQVVRAVEPPASTGPTATASRAKQRITRPSASRLISAVDVGVVACVAVFTPNHLVALAVFGVIAFAMLRQAGLQRPRLSLSLLDDLPLLVTTLLAAIGLTAAVRSLARGGEPLSGLLASLAAAALLVVVGRVCTYAAVRWARRSGRVRHATLVIGCGLVGVQFAQALRDYPQYGLNPVGFIDDEPLVPAPDRPAPVLGRTADLADVIDRHGVEDVVVAFSSTSETDMIDILHTCDRMGVEIFTVPRLFEMYTGGRLSDNVRGLPLTRLRRPTFRSAAWSLKRTVDVLVSSVALVLLSPVMLFCALATRLEGGPGVIFRQKRIGLDGAAFELLKFRSLTPSDDSEAATTWNVASDQRMGRVGRVMRRLSIDELPQLWNIVRGDMSLVGPRPERPFFVSQFGLEHREYLHRHRVPCGLTGWAQVNGLRGDTSIGERARYDNFYIENWSLWFDVKIILRTAAQVVRMAGS